MFQGGGYFERTRSYFGIVGFGDSELLDKNGSNLRTSVEVDNVGRVDAIVILYSFVFLFVNVCFGSWRSVN